MKTNLNTKSRIISIAIALAMVLSVFCSVTAQPVAAASKSKTYTSTPLCISAKYKDKDGSYYIWTDSDKDGQTLKCAKSAAGKAKVLATASADQTILDTAITDGKTIYYAVTEKSPNTTTFYKTAVNQKKPSKIKTMKGPCEPAAYYKGKLYYIENNKKLYALNAAKKTIKLAQKSFKHDKMSVNVNAYGKYIIRTRFGKTMSAHQYLYNIDTKKETKLPDAVDVTIYGNDIYYYCFKNEGAVINKCNLSGKNVKHIKTLKRASILNLGRKAAWLSTGYSDSSMKKLTYKTGKVTKVK